MNEVEERGCMDYCVETSNDDICVTLETIIDRITPKMELFEYNFLVMGVDFASPSSNLNSPTNFFDNIFVFGALDRMIHYRQLLEMEDSCNIPSHPQAKVCYLQSHPWTYFSYRYLSKIPGCIKENTLTTCAIISNKHA
jgi:hypothetical protein